MYCTIITVIITFKASNFLLFNHRSIFTQQGTDKKNKPKSSDLTAQHSHKILEISMNRQRCKQESAWHNRHHMSVSQGGVDITKTDTQFREEKHESEHHLCGSRLDKHTTHLTLSPQRFNHYLSCMEHATQCKTKEEQEGRSVQMNGYSKSGHDITTKDKMNSDNMMTCLCNYAPIAVPMPFSDLSVADDAKM
ncbi:hypothetical protein E2C01_027556 [Portunus trituberculatus]|uniref:Uncharacterized protein n=1 Tax=Portunus trituberculatus TaxID=210409 RepID=A0A5B7EL62_PORTR|nr:hypothetical protein [Portunus trituberculatus]